MGKTRAAYSPEFRRQMVELVRAGRSPEELAREFEPTAQSIRNWLVQSERNAGRGDGGLTTGGGTQAGRLLLSCPSWTPRTQIVRCPRNRGNFNQRLDQTLFHSSRDLGVRQDLGLCLGDATDLREQAPQAHRNTRGGLQSSPLRWQSERRSGECPAITFELRRVHRDHVLDGVSRR